MVIKKKVLCLGLLVSLLGIGNVMQAYVIQLVNRTQHQVRFNIRYKGKKGFAGSDEKTIHPGGAKFLDPTHGIRDVRAFVYHKGAESSSTKKVVFPVTPAGYVNADATYAIEGPRSKYGTSITFDDGSVYQN